LLWALEHSECRDDTWSRRAYNNRENHLAAIREITTYRSLDRYSRAVRDLDRLLAIAGNGKGVEIGLADYRDRTLSPLRSSDLVTAAERYHLNPFFPWFSRRLPPLLDGVRTVGFSLNYLGQALSTFAMAGFIRREFPTVNLLLGGGLVTSWMARPDWRDPFSGIVDRIVAGAGEKAILEHVGVRQTDEHVPPEYAHLPMESYLAPGLILPYGSSRGCHWNRCSFCPERAEGNVYTPVGAGEVLSDLQTLVARHHPVLIHFLDNAIPPAMLRSLAMNPPGVPWYGFVRVSGSLTEPDFCMALRRSGCVMLKLGIESGDQEVLERLHKGIYISMVPRVLDNLRKAGIATYCYLLFGTPAESEPAAQRTLEFVAANREAIGFLNLAIFNMPLFGDEAGEHETGEFYEGDLSLYTAFRHPQGWDRRKVRQFLSREFMRHPAVAPILRRTPPVFTSSHAPFFC
jgi:hypothetical protein